MTSTGEPRRRKGNYAGAAVHDARTPTIKSMPACRLAIEVGGRWSHEATQFLSLLAHKKARDAPPAPRPCFTTALLARLTAIHTHPCGHARLCVVLLSLPAGDYPNPEALPPNGQLLAHYPESSTNPSRLPPIMDVAFPSWSGPQRSWATWRDLREKGRKKKRLRRAVLRTLAQKPCPRSSTMRAAFPNCCVHAGWHRSGCPFKKKELVGPH